MDSLFSLFVKERNVQKNIFSLLDWFLSIFNFDWLQKCSCALGARRSEIFSSYLVKLLPLDVLQRHITISLSGGEAL